MTNFKQYDVVIVGTNLLHVPKYSSGTIVHIHNDDWVEVEFLINNYAYIKTVNKNLLTLRT